MKRWPSIAIGLAIVLAASVCGIAQEPSMPAPQWSVGDMWTYAIQVPDQPRQIVTTVVIGARDNDYTIRTIQSDGKYAVSSIPRGNMAISNVETLTWPLSVGQRWSGSYLEKSTNPPTPIKQEGTVDAYELLTVPAGTFGAFRVVIRSCGDAPQGACGNMRLWVASQVKVAVKFEIDREQIWRALRGFTMLLVAYAVAP